jgi:hypothetical protein
MSLRARDQLRGRGLAQHAQALDSGPSTEGWGKGNGRDIMPLAAVWKASHIGMTRPVDSMGKGTLRQ